MYVYIHACESIGNSNLNNRQISGFIVQCMCERQGRKEGKGEDGENVSMNNEDI